MQDEAFQPLITYMESMPAIRPGIAREMNTDGTWYVKFRIDIGHSLAWYVVQELGCVVNYLSLNERLPTVFYPVSPAPYMNGGPDDFLSWIIESTVADFTPADLQTWLEGRLPDPVNDPEAWPLDE